MAQPVFKTGEAWQPHAGPVRLRGRSVMALARHNNASAPPVATTLTGSSGPVTASAWVSVDVSALRLWITFLLTTLMIAGCGMSHKAGTSTSTRFLGTPALRDVTARGFTLVDQDGKTVSLAGQRGRWVLLTFLYTHCPDVCPLTAQRLNAVLQALGPTRQQVRVLAVSVDPKGDTPAAVRRFVTSHRLLPQFRYLTGSRAELERVWISYNVVSAIKGAARLFHTAVTILIDPHRRIRFYYSTPETSGALHDLRILTAAPGKPAPS